MRGLPCGGYNVSMQELRERTPEEEPENDDPEHVPLPWWVPPLFGAAALILVPWTLWLTLSLPARHVTYHYDLAWVVFDAALATAFAATAFAAVRRSQWLVPLAAATATMLVCDAWFDVSTSAGGDDLAEAILEAVFVELPLAAICGFIVYDAETFLQTTAHHYTELLRRMGRRGD